MVAELDDDDPWVSSASTSLIGSGGKGLRASLLVHCAQIGAVAPIARALDGAAAIEMLHLGTLVHDDIADRAATRRGTIALNQQWGNWTAALVGARMFVRSTAILVEIAPSMRGRLIELVLALCTGQAQDLAGTPLGVLAHDGQLRAYLHTAQRKTASLFSFACELGAVLGHADPERQRLAALWGTRFGVLYQLVDDMLDLFADERLLGKAPGSDLCEGRSTFPWLITRLDPSAYRKRASDGDRSALLLSARQRVIEAGGVLAAHAFARALAADAERIRKDLEGDAESGLSEAMASLLRRLAAAHDAFARTGDSPAACEQDLDTLHKTLAELDERPSMFCSPAGPRASTAAAYEREQMTSLMLARAPELAIAQVWAAPQATAVALVAQAASDTARAFGGKGDDLAETGRWCALSVDLLAGLRNHSYAADCGLLLAGDAAMVLAVGHVLTLDLEAVSEILRGVEQAIRRTLRMASPGLPFGGRAIQPTGAQLQPLAAALARVTARRVGAGWVEARAIAELWVLLMDLSTDASRCALPRHALLGDMHERIANMSLSEPAVFLASLSSLVSNVAPRSTATPSPLA